jgi:hypothetical protein
MSYQQDRGRFLEAMRQEGMSEADARAILRDAQTIQRCAVDACNGELTKRQILVDEAAQARILRRCAIYNGEGFEAKFQDDPRGACVKIIVPSGRSDSWSGEGMCVPTRS